MNNLVLRLHIFITVSINTLPAFTEKRAQTEISIHLSHTATKSGNHILDYIAQKRTHQSKEISQ